MKPNHFQKFKKVLIIIVSPIIVTLLLLIIFNSAISKYIVRKYDEKLTGRNITMEWAHVNPLTGIILFSNLKIFEQSSDSIFFSADAVDLKISIRKLFFRTFEISRLTLNHPYGVIIQNKKNLNINDLSDKFLEVIWFHNSIFFAIIREWLKVWFLSLPLNPQVELIERHLLVKPPLGGLGVIFLSPHNAPSDR